MQLDHSMTWKIREPIMEPAFARTVETDRGDDDEGESSLANIPLCEDEDDREDPAPPPMDTEEDRH